MVEVQGTKDARFDAVREVTNDLGSGMTVAYSIKRMQNVAVGDERGLALIEASGRSLAGTG